MRYWRELWREISRWWQQFYQSRWQRKTLSAKDKLGRDGERAAARFLQKSGYAILHRNLRLGKSEVDIVAQNGDEIVFVEVKTRRSDRFGDPEIAVQKRKKRAMLRFVREYLREHVSRRAKNSRNEIRWRIDVIAVLWRDGSEPEFTHIKDAFMSVE